MPASLTNSTPRFPQITVANTIAVAPDKKQPASERVVSAPRKIHSTWAVSVFRCHLCFLFKFEAQLNPILVSRGSLNQQSGGLGLNLPSTLNLQWNHNGFLISLSPSFLICERNLNEEIKCNLCFGPDGPPNSSSYQGQWLQKVILHVALITAIPEPE